MFCILILFDLLGCDGMASEVCSMLILQVVMENASFVGEGVVESLTRLDEVP